MRAAEATKATPELPERSLRESDLGRIDSTATEYRPHRQAAPVHIDPRLALLASASARFDLVNAGAMTLDEALDNAFIEQFRWIGGLVCYCEFESMQNFDRIYQEKRRRELQEWRWRRR